MNLISDLRDMTSRERLDALEELVVADVRQALLMEQGEELPLDQGFFDLGLTSLKLTEIRSHLEDALGIELDATELFTRPTVEQLVEHLAGVVVAGRPRT